MEKVQEISGQPGRLSPREAGSGCGETQDVLPGRSHHPLVRALYDALLEARGEDICVYVKVMANASTLKEQT
jgi:hypothetical protein